MIYALYFVYSLINLIIQNNLIDSLISLQINKGKFSYIKQLLTYDHNSNKRNSCILGNFVLKSLKDDDLVDNGYSLSYNPLDLPNQRIVSQDLEDLIVKRSLRFLKPSNKLLEKYESCYLVGLEDKSNIVNVSDYTLEESLSELSELAGAAGLLVKGSTYQRLDQSNNNYYIGPGKLKEISQQLKKLKCSCVIFDTELSPSQQKHLEIAFNEDANEKDKRKKSIKVIDRTALILDIFAQHARTKEGQLQVQLALMTYRLPRLTNMWSHLERQSAGARGKSNGGVGLRGPGEKQLESDKREMKKKISILRKTIDSVRSHRMLQRTRRKRLGLPVVALVGYTNAGKSTVLNSFSGSDVYTADMLFATLDPTTRIVSMPGLKCPNILLTDTVGFISKIPTHLVAAFRATLEEISEADVLLHVIDVSNPAWKKQESAVLQELTAIGLTNKPIITIWNKIDLVPDIKEQFKYLASKQSQTIAMSALDINGSNLLIPALETALRSYLEEYECFIPYEYSYFIDSIHQFGILDKIEYTDTSIYINGKLPRFLKNQIVSVLSGNSNDLTEMDNNDIDNENYNDIDKYIDNLSIEDDVDNKENDANDDEYDETKLLTCDDYY